MVRIMGGRGQQKTPAVVKKDVIRVKAKKYANSNAPPETRTFSADPELTRYATLRELLSKAFNISGDFAISYLISAYNEEEEKARYSPIVSEWDLNTAMYAASDPYLVLRVDTRKMGAMKEGLEEWDIIDEEDLARIGRSCAIPMAREYSDEDHIDDQDSNNIPSPPPPRSRFSWLFSSQRSNSTSSKTPSSNAAKSDIVRSDRRSIRARGRPLSAVEFETYKDSEGRFLRTDALLRTVYECGVTPEARRTVWPHLLDVYPERSTELERHEYSRRLCQKYECLRESWLDRLRRGYALDEELRLVANAVRKDVVRTDRHHSYFAGDEDRNGNLMSLFNILTTYALSHPETSYCQGMSDLASPLLMVIGDESMTYLCFCALMRRARENFSCDGWSMTRKFHHLSDLLRSYDPQLHEYLSQVHSEDLLFTYRWLLLDLKREFEFDDALRLMEVSWASRCVRVDGGEESAATRRVDGCESDLYDIDLTATDDEETVVRRRIEERSEMDDDVEETVANNTVVICPASLVRSLVFDQKENRRLHAIRHHASYPPRFATSHIDSMDEDYGPRRARSDHPITNGRWYIVDEFDIGNGVANWLGNDASDDRRESDGPLDDGRRPSIDRLKVAIAGQQLSSTDSTGGSTDYRRLSSDSSNDSKHPPAIVIGARNQSSTSIRPSPELKVKDDDLEDSNDPGADTPPSRHHHNHEPIPVASEAAHLLDVDPRRPSDDSALTLSRIHEICLANIPMDEEATSSSLISSKASSICRRSREPSGGAPSADSGVFDCHPPQPPMLDETQQSPVVANDCESLPQPDDLGGQVNAFVLFVCLSILLQHSQQIQQSRLDFNEIAVHFDRLTKRHDLKEVLRRARGLYEEYVRKAAADRSKKTSGNRSSAESPKGPPDLGVTRAISVQKASP